MFKFFNSRRWFLWAWMGSLIIISSLWFQVSIDVKINEWFGVFYDMIQKALSAPNAVTIEELFDGVRSIHFLSYIRYLYFNIGRIAYLQANVLSAYVFLAPAIVAGAVTLGVMQQIIREFGRVEGSMQYILKAWPTIIELASVYKRLREFESKINQEDLIDEKA